MMLFQKSRQRHILIRLRLKIPIDLIVQYIHSDYTSLLFLALVFLHDYSIFS